jgi:hypothetical protein
MSFSTSVRHAFRRSGFTQKQVTLLEANVGSGGGGGASVLRATDVPDQTITLDAASTPQDVMDLWRIDGPGLIAVAGWYEIKPFDDDDYAGLTIIADTDLGLGQLASNGGPDARTYTPPSELLTGGWIRQHVGAAFPDIMMPSQWREYKLQISGFHYHDDDPGDTTTPVLGDVQIRNARIVAVSLGS